MEKRLKDKVVIVTGGTKGIGRRMASMLVEEGASVVISGRNKEDGENVVTEIKRDYHGEALFVQGDLSQVSTCKELIDVTVEKFGRIDGLVNNAAVFPRATLLETKESMYDEIFEVNLKAAFFCSKHAIQEMQKTGGGSIVHIGSTHGYRGHVDLAAYASSKGGMRTLNQHIAEHYGRDKIRSNWITVGWVASDGEVSRVEKDGVSKDELIQQASEEVPSGRPQTYEDIGYGVIYLLSDESTQVTFSELHISGGFNI